MKTLIVDDEKHARQAIRLLVNWGALDIADVLEAENGEEAIDILLSEHPQVVVTDMKMPVRDGISLMEWIQAHAPKCKTIVVSGHKDYEFLRGAMKYGGIDYLLKPIDPHQLRDAVRKAVSAWKSEHLDSLQTLHRNMEFNELKSLRLYQTLTALIDKERPVLSDNDRIVREILQSKDVAECHVAVLSLACLPQPLLDRFQSSRELLDFALLNICNELLAFGQLGIAFKHQQKEDEIVLLLWADQMPVDTVVHEIHESIRMLYHVRLAFGVGSARPFPHQLKASYLEASDLLAERGLLDNRWICVHGTDAPVSQPRLYFRDWEERIGIAVKHSGKDRIEAAVDDWLDAVQRTTSVTISHLRQWEKEIEIVLTQLEDNLPEQHRPKLKHHRIDPLSLVRVHEGRLAAAGLKDALLARLFDLSDCYRRAKESSRKNSVVDEIARFVRDNYNRELTLQEIAEHFFLSREYVCRRFKQDTGENLIDYLSRLRIGKAKELLANPHLKIVDISQAVGYQDGKYFSKVFKKLEGVSPNEYRRLNE